MADEKQAESKDGAPDGKAVQVQVESLTTKALEIKERKDRAKA